MVPQTGGGGAGALNGEHRNREENTGRARKSKQNMRSKGRKKNKVMRIMNTNAQSLINKMDVMEVRVREQKPKVISVTETWGKEWIKDGILDLKGYKMYRDDRNIKRGGVLYYTSVTNWNTENVNH